MRRHWVQIALEKIAMREGMVEGPFSREGMLAIRVDLGDALAIMFDLGAERREMQLPVAVQDKRAYVLYWSTIKYV